MCEYSNDASFNLDCLDVIDDILSVDWNKRVISSPKRGHQRRKQHEQEQTSGSRRSVTTQAVRVAAVAAAAAAATTTTIAEAVACETTAGRSAGNKLSNQTSSSPSSSPSPEQHSYTTEQSNSTKSDQMSWRNDNLITCMLITANVGTIFEESNLLELWFQQLKSYLIKIKPQLVAIHCQEVGGKNYETSMRNVSNFTDKILGDETIIGEYSRVRIFLDENFQCLEKFTALGSLYLIHDSVDNVKLYNFKTAQYDPVEGRDVYAVSDKDDVSAHEDYQSDSSNTANQHQQSPNQGKKLAEHVEKVKFPQELFPECRWSRKGFMRTRWLFHESQPLDLVNIHLFHDASNLVAMRATPSPYAQIRQKALDFALERISKPLSLNSSNNNIDESINQKLGSTGQVPLFIFGDFNFRLDTNRVIQRITEGISPVVRKSVDSDEVLEIVYHRKNDNVARSDCDCNSQKKERAISDNGNEVRTPNMYSSDDSNSNYIKDSEIVMTIGKKLFDCENLDEMFRAAKNTEWLLELDNELDSFKNKLHEFKISFSPSYPFKEDESGGHSYMKTRCPSWCDRILFNDAGNQMIYGKNLDDDEGSTTSVDNEKKIASLQSQGDVIYRLMGNSVPMGDHKPVLLYCQLRLAPQDPSTKCKPTHSAISAESSGGLVQSTAI